MPLHGQNSNTRIDIFHDTSSPYKIPATESTPIPAHLAADSHVPASVLPSIQLLLDKLKSQVFASETDFNLFVKTFQSASESNRSFQAQIQALEQDKFTNDFSLDLRLRQQGIDTA